MTEASSPLALDVEGVSHRFGGRTALDDVSLSVGAGRFCALLGPNGAGKTTLFSLITRLYDNTSGAVRVLGQDVRRAPSAALRRLGVVFQSRTIDADLSVAQNLAYHAALHGMSRREAAARAEAELERIGMAARAGDKVRALSGGQVRRVEIARALLHRPALLLLDEPTVGLDIASRRELVAHVRHLVEADGIGVLWATHLIDEVQATDEIYILHQGRVRARGPVGEVAKSAGAATLAEAFDALTTVSGAA